MIVQAVVLALLTIVSVRIAQKQSVVAVLPVVILYLGVAYLMRLVGAGRSIVSMVSTSVRTPLGRARVLEYKDIEYVEAVSTIGKTEALYAVMSEGVRARIWGAGGAVPLGRGNIDLGIERLRMLGVEVHDRRLGEWRAR